MTTPHRRESAGKALCASSAEGCSGKFYIKVIEGSNVNAKECHISTQSKRISTKKSDKARWNEHFVFDILDEQEVQIQVGDKSHIIQLRDLSANLIENTISFTFPQSEAGTPRSAETESNSKDGQGSEPTEKKKSKAEKEKDKDKEKEKSSENSNPSDGSLRSSSPRKSKRFFRTITSRDNTPEQSPPPSRREVSPPSRPAADTEAVFGDYSSFLDTLSKIQQQKAASSPPTTPKASDSTAVPPFLPPLPLMSLPLPPIPTQPPEPISNPANDEPVEVNTESKLSHSGEGKVSINVPSDHDESKPKKKDRRGKDYKKLGSESDSDDLTQSSASKRLSSILRGASAGEISEKEKKRDSAHGLEPLRDSEERTKKLSPRERKGSTDSPKEKRSSKIMEELRLLKDRAGSVSEIKVSSPRGEPSVQRKDSLDDKRRAESPKPNKKERLSVKATESSDSETGQTLPRKGSLSSILPSPKKRESTEILEKGTRKGSLTTTSSPRKRRTSIGQHDPKPEAKPLHASAEGTPNRERRESEPEEVASTEAPKKKERIRDSLTSISFKKTKSKSAAALINTVTPPESPKASPVVSPIFHSDSGAEEESPRVGSTTESEKPDGTKPFDQAGRNRLKNSKGGAGTTSQEVSAKDDKEEKKKGFRFSRSSSEKKPVDDSKTSSSHDPEMPSGSEDAKEQTTPQRKISRGTTPREEGSTSLESILLLRRSSNKMKAGFKSPRVERDSSSKSYSEGSGEDPAAVAQAPPKPVRRDSGRSRLTISRASSGAKEKKSELHVQLAFCNYDFLTRKVLSGDFLMAILETPLSDSVAQSVMALLWHHNLDTAFTRRIIREEVTKTTYASQLFRLDSSISKLLVAYLRNTGSEWLSKITSPVVSMMTNSAKAYTVDPSKLGQGEVLEINQTNLIEVIEMTVKVIEEAADFIPHEVFDVCSQMYEEVNKKYPDNALKSVSGLIFLRFICPSFLQPIINGQPIEQRVQRGLISSTKALQNMANEISFGQKEHFMSEFNPLLDSLSPQIRSFIHSLTGSSNSPRPQKRLSQSQYVNSIQVIAAHIHKHFDAIQKFSQQSTIPFDWELETLKTFANTMNFLQTLDSPKP